MNHREVNDLCTWVKNGLNEMRFQGFLCQPTHSSVQCAVTQDILAFYVPRSSRHRESSHHHAR